jgi:hypothetical protein
MSTAKNRLVPCPDCDQPISARAPVCLHCGREIRPTLWGLLWGAGRGVVKISLVWCFLAAISAAILFGTIAIADALGIKP